MDKLKVAMADARSNGKKPAVLFIDLDNFKTYILTMEKVKRLYLKMRI